MSDTTASRLDGAKLHRLVTEVLITALEGESPDMSAVDKAIKFLKDNGITAFDMEGLVSAVTSAGPARPHLPDPGSYEDEDAA